MKTLTGPPSSWPEECGARRCDLYLEGRFRAICIGNVYQGRYVVLGKLGFGMHSTVWLVHDARTERYFAMKVLSTETTGTKRDGFELEVLKHLQSSNTDHPGHPYVSNLVDSFQSWSIIGLTVFLIFELMGETLGRFTDRKSFPIEQVMPLKYLKRFAKQLLLGLDHAHKSGVVHTDLKLDNIMIQIPDQSVVETRWLKSPAESATAEQPESEFLPSDPNDRLRLKFGIQHDDERRKFRYDIVSKGLEEIYLDDPPSDEVLLNLNAVIVDWGLAEWTDNHFNDIISPPMYRSPECLIGAPWDTKTDIWMLGLILIRLAEGFEPFEGRSYEQQFEYGRFPRGEELIGQAKHLRTNYNFGAHLNEIATMIEPFPRSLLERANKKHKWFLDSIFSDDGTVWGYDFCDAPRLENFFTALEEGEDKQNFLGMIRKMMRVDPNDRSSAEELLMEPWLQDVALDRANDEKPSGSTISRPEDHGLPSRTDNVDDDGQVYAPSDVDTSEYMQGSEIITLHATDHGDEGYAPSDADASDDSKGSPVLQPYTANDSEESYAPSDVDSSEYMQGSTIVMTPQTVDLISQPKFDTTVVALEIPVEISTGDICSAEQDASQTQEKETVTHSTVNGSTDLASEQCPPSENHAISPQQKEERTGNSVAIANVNTSTEIVSEDLPPSPRKRKLSQDKGTNSGGKKKNKKRKRGGKR
ncbi:hypothetical protein FKW77_009814 [Venturia effusa]|uniref:non-specific serine/threonine protein kinase n=1 Tax=Venturia effusa TaxID=50376 RepID=A0A517LA05_9PEZI|nr:hypothetical protein FKW77_009814 [Venturia effusa]